MVTRQSHGERMKTCYILMGLRQTLSRKKCVNRYVKTEKIIWCRRADLHVPVAGSSCISNDFSEDIESLKLVQSSNGEVACVAGLLNIGLQQSQGNLVFRGRERTQKSYWLKS